MKFIAIEPNDTYFHEAIKLYDATFPIEIKESVQVFLDSFKTQEQDPDFFHFHVLIDNNQLVGFSSFHYLKSENIAYIVYIVINEKYKGQGLGSMFMKHIFETIENLAMKYHHNKPSFMLECEKDDAGNSPLEAFYKRFDFEKSAVCYHQPDLHHKNQHVPMNLFIKNHPSQEAISTMYTAKYNQCNRVDLNTLAQLIAQF